MGSAMVDALSLFKLALPAAQKAGALIFQKIGSASLRKQLNSIANSMKRAGDTDAAALVWAGADEFLSHKT